MVLYVVYFRLTVQPMNLVTLAGRVQIQLLQTMQPLALGGALVPRGQNIKLKLFNNRTKPCWDISLDCRAREDHIPSFEVPMDQLEHHSGDSHVSPKVVARVPLWLYETGGGHGNVPGHHLQGWLNFNLIYVDKKVHGGPWTWPWPQWGTCRRP